MASITTTLARRGMEVAAGAFASYDKQEAFRPTYLIPLVLTSFIFFTIFFATSYTYGRVVPILAMVEEEEEPSTHSYVSDSVLASDSSTNAASAHLLEADEKHHPKNRSYSRESSAHFRRPQPVTSNLHGTVLHLQARAGYWSRFRGLSLFLCMTIVHRAIVVALVATVFTRSLAGFVLANISAEVILSRWYMTWIHIVISEPSSKSWYQRLPPMKTWPKIAPAVALQATVNQIASILPVLVYQSFKFSTPAQDPAFESWLSRLQLDYAGILLYMFLTLSFFVLLEIPAAVTLVRVAASMLPEEDQTIVSFDRTFGGKLSHPASEDGTARIGLLEAWRGFPWASRKRLLKLIAKVFIMLLCISILFLPVLIAQALLAFGIKPSEAMEVIKS